MAGRPLSDDELRVLSFNLAILAKQVERLRTLTERSPTSPLGLYGSSFQLRGCVVDIRVPSGVTLETILDESFAGHAAEAYAKTALHEFAHWFQYACTPYGMYLVRAQEAQTSVVRAVCQGIVDGLTDDYGMPALPPRTLPMPFFEWLRANLDLNTKWGMLSLSMFRRWLAGEDMVAALEGFDARQDPAELASAFMTLEGMRSDPTALLRFPNTKPTVRGLIMDEPVQPLVDGEPFGAHRVAECAATLQACADYDAFDESTLVGDYRPAYQLVREKFPDAPTGHVVRTVLALTEVAFWSDIFPCLRKRTWRRKDMRWKDIHPGWRFVRMVDALESIGLLCRFEDYHAFVRKVTDTFGWTSIDTLATRALFRIKPTDPNPLLQAFGLSCAVRKKDPAAFALWIEAIVNGVAGASHPDLQPKLWWWNGQRMRSDDGDLLHVVHDMHLITRQFMLGTRFERKHLLMRDYEEAAFAAVVKSTLHLPPESFIQVGRR
ncbi:hypothetical protein [Streptomyces sp. NPDC047108]|uniref:hypothetical protein n=1 Tax=Streptomyces sp. NPDC047108 TaxID=3155025 RepID=UPI003405E96C